MRIIGKFTVRGSNYFVVGKPEGAKNEEAVTDHPLKDGDLICLLASTSLGLGQDQCGYSDHHYKKITGDTHA